MSPRTRGWAGFLTSSQGQALVRSSLAHCEGLNSLYMQHVATDSLLRVVADTCTRLTILDISFSRQVTDQGLVQLCGPPAAQALAPRGCKYLRELYFNPHSQPADRQIRPRVIACLLTHLEMLQVVDLSNLHPGIEEYYLHYRHRYASLKPLNLLHYTGQSSLQIRDISWIRLG